MWIEEVQGWPTVKGAEQDEPMDDVDINASNEDPHHDPRQYRQLDDAEDDNEKAQGRLV